MGVIKYVLCGCFVWVSINASDAIVQIQESKEYIYEQNCMKCHKQMSLTMQKIFMRYLLKYSSEVSVKSALMDFLKNPNYFTSALRKDQITRYGLKHKTTLDDESLRKAIDFYWEKYKIFGKLK